MGFDPVVPGERRVGLFLLEDLRGSVSVSGHSCYLPVRCIGIGLWHPNTREERPPYFCYESHDE
eukprot:126892-Lingulodinium_polyedra.AAC.1